MMRPRRLVLLAALVAVLQLAFLGWLVADRAAILRGGTSVTLEVGPVDPRDLLRGDYVILGYEISTLAADLFPAGLPSADGERTVHVRLRPDAAGIHRPVAAFFGDPPDAPSAGEVDIRGTASSSRAPARPVAVRYGIERYYVPEGEGRDIERAMRDTQFSVVVAVAADGRAQIRALLNAGEPIYREPLF